MLEPKLAYHTYGDASPGADDDDDALTRVDDDMLMLPNLFGGETTRVCARGEVVALRPIRS